MYSSLHTKTIRLSKTAADIDNQTGLHTPFVCGMQLEFDWTIRLGGAATDDHLCADWLKTLSLRVVRVPLITGESSEDGRRQQCWVTGEMYGLGGWYPFVHLFGTTEDFDTRKLADSMKVSKEEVGHFIWCSASLAALANELIWMPPRRQLGPWQKAHDGGG